MNLGSLARETKCSTTNQPPSLELETSKMRKTYFFSINFLKSLFSIPRLISEAWTEAGAGEVPPGSASIKDSLAVRELPKVYVECFQQTSIKNQLIQKMYS